MRGVLPVALAGLCVSALNSDVFAQQRLQSQVVASGLTRPVWVGAAPGDNTRLFVIEQRVLTSTNNGRIRVINNANTTPALNATPFWTSPVVAFNTSVPEQGLLGMAFHPGYAQNGFLFVNYTRSDGSTVIARIRRGTSPDLADAAFLETVLVITQPAPNHNGGWIEFGPEGHLYIAMGDGGGSNDNQAPSGGTTGNAQDITDNLLGKVLRIDVDGPDNIPGNADDDGFPADANRLYTIPAGNPFVGITGDDEIWHYGVRNPWRNSFDRATGQLWIADVGQDFREEINRIPAGVGGLNLGWRCYEGTATTGLGGCNPPPSPVHMPITQYANSPNAAITPFPFTGCSITGGVVYRGAAMPCMQGRYIFADYCSGDIYTFKPGTGTITEILSRRVELDPPGTPTIANVTSFGMDNQGEVYICDQSGGEIIKILPNGFLGSPADCDNDGLPDWCEIENGAPDANNNGIPDSCEGPTCDSIDFNGDGLFPDTGDIDDFLSVFSGGPCSTGTCGDIDFNNDGLFPDTGDIDALLSVFGGGPCL